MDRQEETRETVPNLPWTGQRVAFTGRLTALTRQEARRLVLRCGGQVSTDVTRGTTTLVVGTVRLPLNKKGRLTRKIQRAQLHGQRGRPVEILDEATFMARSGVAATEGQHRTLYSLGDMERVLGLSRDRLRGLLRGGLIEPVEYRQGVPLFRFEQVRRLKTLIGLLEAGVTLKRVRRSLLRLNQLLPVASAAIESLQLVDRWGRRLVMRFPDGSLRDTSGQQMFDFAALSDDDVTTVPLPRDRYAEALALESQGDLAAAIAAYEQLLLHDGPDDEVCFQLANVLYRVGRFEAACERFRQAVELEPDFAEAWNNLGNVLGQLGRQAEAVEAYRCAVSLDPGWADARFGLADLLDEAGRQAEAAEHWRQLLDPAVDPEYARYASSRLARSR
jgi:tetratricopeptide (TPR) repeat protein